MSTPNETQPLKVIARAPFEVYYEGNAHAVTASNKVGIFDVLADHADFFSVLVPGEVTIETAGEPVSFIVKNGIIAVRDNSVMIFANM
jgi:F0F1-type ATP synthase epsilon subunit